MEQNKHKPLLNTQMREEDVKKMIRDVPDFPRKGILFKDLTTAFKDPDCMKYFEDEMYEMYKGKGITKVLGIESRGFIMAPILGNRLKVGFVPIRKKENYPLIPLKKVIRKNMALTP